MIPCRTINSPKEQLRLIALSLAGVPEFIFHPTRKWRFDWAWPDRKIAVEYNGHHSTGLAKGISKKTSGHSSIGGITNDAEKGNQASLLGWHVIRFTALHFNAKDRKKHGLFPPLETLQQLLAQ